MRLHTLTNVPGSRVRSKRLGRGRSSGLGKTSGKGHKGQMARKGHKRKLGFEGGQMPLLRRMPKRGFHNPARRMLTPVNVGNLNRFEDGAEINIPVLISSGLAKKVRDGIKILGIGDLERKLAVKATAFSITARTKIEAAGGSCETV